VPTRLLSLPLLLLLLGCTGCGGVPCYTDANGIEIPRRGLGDGLPPQENPEDRRLLDFESLYVYVRQDTISSGDMVIYRAGTTSGFDRFWADGRMLFNHAPFSIDRLRPEELTAAHGDDLAFVRAGRYTVVGREIYIEHLLNRYPSGPQFHIQKGRILENGDIRWTHYRWQGSRRWRKWPEAGSNTSAVAKKIKVGKMNFVPTW